jgi:two-component system, OmpR family, phosphate regulon response regulator PhoB
VGSIYVAEKGPISGPRQDFLPVGRRIPVVWILERESRIERLAVEHFNREGFEVRMLPVGIDVVQRVEYLQPSLVIIEAMTSRRRALEICRHVRWLQFLARIPVVLISANASEEDRVLGLEAGADDYIAELSSGRELLARVRAVMRRLARKSTQSGMTSPTFGYLQSPAETASTLRVGDIEIDPVALKISVRGGDIETTTLEYRLLYYLLLTTGGCVHANNYWMPSGVLSLWSFAA